MRNNNNKPEETLALHNQIIVVDTSVQNWQSLIAGVGPDVQVILLEPGRDGLAQIAEALQGRHDIPALHIVSHGAAGTLVLGTTVLNADTLADHAALLSQIGHSLTAAGDILLYGCNVAAGDNGRAFIEQLAAATGADVAASVNATGSAALGGNWNLEGMTGPVETPIIAPTFDFQGMLAAPSLVKAGIFMDTSASPNNLNNVNGTLYFLADDRIRGQELWKSDGTEAGTVRVRDIAPGGASNYLTHVNGTLYFTAYDGTSGTELWKSDGTEPGTVRVKDIFPGTGSSSPTNLTNVNGTLFFVADDGTSGAELWKSDGTEAGTVLVKDLYPPGYYGSSNPSNFTNVNGTLFFTATTPTNGTELWRSDGTEAGTVSVKDIVAGVGSSNPTNLTNVNDTLYFSATDGTSGQELWKSDGTEAGTVLVKDIYAGTIGSSPASLTNVNGTLYFAATNDAAGGRELWKTDGSEAGTVRVKDIYAGAEYSSPANLTNVNGTLYFVANDGTSGQELWKSNGTEAGTVRVKDIVAGTGSSSPTNLTNVNGTLLFQASDPTNGAELWKSDGTAAGTVRVKDIYSGTVGSSPSYLTDVNGTLYFRADNGTNGLELWKSDGTEAGTAQVRNIAIVGTGPDSYTGPVSIGQTLYFVTTEPTSGYELWKSDGSAAGTVRVKDIVAGTGNSSPTDLTNVNGTLFFTAEDGYGRELWKSDGTAAGTVQVKDIYPGGSSGTESSYSDLTNVNDTLYFAANNATGGTELWKSDGTSAGTIQVKDIYSGANGSFPYSLTNVNGTLYFRASDGTSGVELWKSDGTAVGTVRVKDIVTGSNSSSPEMLTDVNSTLFFTAADGSGRELWKSDGTEAGTVRVKDIYSGANGSNPINLTNVNGTLYFLANDGTSGQELWKSDGTEIGTVQLKDIVPGIGNSTPNSLTNVNGTLYFLATDATHGTELWKSDGTEAGTVLVKDIWQGALSSNVQSLTAFDGQLYFVADDGINGPRLWQSDGTANGTVMIASAEHCGAPVGLVNADGILYFSAYDANSQTRGLWTIGGSAQTNQPPVLTGSQASLAATDEDVAVTLTETALLQGFTDPNGDALNVANLTADHGTIAANGEDSWLFTPTPNYNGLVSFTYDVTDGKGGLTPATLGQTVIPVNDAPIVANALPDQGMTQGVAFSYTVPANTFSDVDGDSLTLEASLADGSPLPAWLSFNVANGSFSGTPAQGDIGMITVRVTATDGASAAAEDEFLLTVDNANDYNIIIGTDYDDLLIGTESKDWISALSGNDTIYAFGGNDIVDGGPGADTMYGGLGDDGYVVDNIDDLVIENDDEGGDKTESSVSYTLAPNVENLTLTGSADINGAGNELDNTLTGNTGNNILDGGMGTDTQLGGLGNDTYFVDSDSDVVIENDGEGIDRVVSSVSYSLADNVENLTLIGDYDVSGTGNTLNNILVGNAYANVLDGGAGDDTMIGAQGHDLYVVDSIADVLIENYFEGTDTVESSISYTLGDNIENLVLSGSENLLATGNTISNVIYGNAGNNIIDGQTGGDILLGKWGNDIYFVDNATDYVIEKLYEGIDEVKSSISYTLTSNVENLTLIGSNSINGTGNELDNTLTGNSGNNIIDGGIGGDILLGNAGDDTLDGGEGTGDTVIFSGNRGDYTITLNGSTYAVTDTRTGSPDGTDTATGMENFQFAGGTTFTTGAGGTLDITSPEVTLVAYGDNDGTLKVGETVQLLVTFSENVTVAGGTPSLSLDTAGTATLTSGSGTNQLSFTYTVADGQNSADLAVTAFNLNGATVKDGQGNNADTTGVAANPDGTMVVNTTPPTAAVAIFAIADDTGTPGDFVTSDTTLTVSGSNDALAAGEKVQVSSDGGNTWADASVSGTAWSYVDSVTHSTSFTYQVRVVDSAGNIGNSASQAISLYAGSATFTGTAGNDTANAVTGILTGFTGGSVAELQDNTGDTFNPLSGTDTIVADSGDDVINLSVDDANSGDSFDGGLGNNTLNFTGGDNTSIDLTGVAVTRISNFTSGDQAQTITMTAEQYAGSSHIFNSIDMGGGTDTLNVNVTSSIDWVSGGYPTLIGVENRNLIGSSSANNIILFGAQLDDFTQVDLGASIDHIHLRSSSTGLNILSDEALQNVEYIHFQNAAGGATVNLTNQSERFVIYGSSVADTITGGAGDDIILGGAGADTINGSAGNDIISEFVAEDTVDGGAGTNDAIQLYQDLNSATDAQIINVETVSVAGGAPGITINLANQTEGFRIFGGFGNDTIIGGSGDDTVDVGAVDPMNGDDLISTGGGNDVIRMVGDDTIDGGAGEDAIYLYQDLNSATDAQITNVEKVYVRQSAGLTINLGNQSEGFTLICPNLYDTWADTITGGSGADTISAGSGDDTVNGFVGADTLVGGGGTDTISLALTSEDLNSAGDAQITDVEAVTAATATAGVTIDLHNQLESFTITGSGFDDTITGGSGLTDIVVFSGNRADYAITLNGPTYTITDTRTDSPNGTDTITGVENFQFPDGTHSTGTGGTLDITAPTITSVDYGANDGTLKAGETVTLVVNLSETVAIAGGTPSLTFDNGGIATLTGGSSTNQLSFAYTVADEQNSADLAVTAFNLNGATVKDDQGNDADTASAVTNPAGTLIVDTTAPTAAVAITAIADDTGTPGDFITSDNSLIVSGTNGALGADETVQVSSDGGSTWADAAQIDATHWSYVDPTTHSTSFSYQARMVDSAGNIGNSISQAITVSTDETAPTVIAVTDDISALVTNSPITFTITFNEPVTGVAASSFTLGNGTVTSVTTLDSSHYAMVVNPFVGVESFVSLKLNAGGAIDIAGNLAVAANLHSLDTQWIDTIPPRVTAVTDDVSAAITNQPINFTVGFREPVTGVTASSFTATNGTVTSVTPVDSSSYTVLVTPNAGVTSGDVSLILFADGAQDAAGNGAESANLWYLDSQAIDTVAPTGAVAITAIVEDTGTPNDFTTSDTTLTVSGTNEALVAGEKVQVSSDGRTWADVTQDSATTWSYDDPLTRSASFTYQARVVDSAGNIGNTVNQAITLYAGAATFTGTVGNDIANANTGTLTGFTGGSLAQLQDNIGDVFNPLGGTDSIVADSGDDVINLGIGDTSSGDSFDGGLGNNTLNFTGGDNTSIDLTGVAITRIGRLTSGDQAQTITMTAEQFAGSSHIFNSIDMGGGTDTLNVNVTSSIIWYSGGYPTLTGVEKGILTGSSNSEQIFLSGEQLNVFNQVDFGAGSSDGFQLYSTSTGLNSMPDEALRNVELIVLRSAAGITVNLGSQSEGFVISGNNQGADTIIGGAGSDYIDGGQVPI